MQGKCPIKKTFKNQFRSVKRRDAFIIPLALRSPISKYIMPSSAAFSPHHFAQMAHGHASLLRPLTTLDDEFSVLHVDVGLDTN